MFDRTGGRCSVCSRSVLSLFLLNLFLCVRRPFTLGVPYSDDSCARVSFLFASLSANSVSVSLLFTLPSASPHDIVKAARQMSACRFRCASVLHARLLSSPMWGSMGNEGDSATAQPVSHCDGCGKRACADSLLWLLSSQQQPSFPCRPRFCFFLDSLTISFV